MVWQMTRAYDSYSGGGGGGGEGGGLLQYNSPIRNIWILNPQKINLP